MATKESLQAREASAKSLDDWVALAREALSEPADKLYARELLGKAEMHCQFPADYIKVAEAAMAAGDKDYAKELYDQAEESAFEGKEFAALGHSLATVYGDRDKGAELIEKGAGEAKTQADFLLFAKYAKDVGNDSLAQSMQAKIEEKAKSVADYRALAESVIKELGDKETAKALYKKGARYCGDVPTTADYAKGMIELFDDSAAARKILDDAETDCQFTKDFTALAGAYKDLFNDGEKVASLMEQAEEFAMTGEENMVLAEAYWKLMQAREQSVAAYDKAIKEITNVDELLRLAKTIATELGDKDMAKKVYAKAEAKMTRAPELAKLAQAVIDDLGDKEYASAIYNRAAESLKSSSELAVLAGEVQKNLGDQARASALYGKALDAAGDFVALTNLFNAARSLENAELTTAILKKTGGLAGSTPEFLQVADATMATVKDKTIAGAMLEQAEERVTSVDEMRKVVKAAADYLPEDTERGERLKQKLEKREANQVRYAEFQKLENALSGTNQTVRLADRVMSELDDPFYAAKLLSKAEQDLDREAFHFHGYETLVRAIDRHLHDEAWLNKLLDACAAKSGDFLGLRSVARTAARLTTQPLGQNAARRFYQTWEQKISGDSAATAYDISKLASAVLEDLNDAAWSAKLLNDAQARASDHYALAHLAHLAHSVGDQARATALLQQAAKSCSSGAQCIELVERLRVYGIDEATQRDVYRQCGEALSAPLAKLRWAEGILDEFRDRDWAAQAYATLDSAFSGAERARFEASRRNRLGTKYYVSAREQHAA